MTSSSPRCARSTAGSSRSAANPAPVPMRKEREDLVMAVFLQGHVCVGTRSVALKGADLGEEQIVSRCRRSFDRADLGHELGGLDDLLRLQRIGVILIADHRQDIIN